MANDSIIGTNLDPRFVCQLRDQLFYMGVYMYTEMEGFEPVPVPYNLIQELVIEETLIDWHVRGWIVLKADFEMFERGSLSYSNKDYGGENVEQIKAPFFFRTDGRNRLNIKIYPLDTSNNQVVSLAAGSLNPELWEMDFDCSIYDIQDLQTNSIRTKLRKFYFWDERYQIFSERNIEWSTGALKSGLLTGSSQIALNESNFTDIERALPAADCLRSIIKTAASNDSTETSPTIKIGFTNGGSISNPTIPLESIDENNWDAGPTKDTLIFYTSPARANVLKDIDYILQNCKSKDNAPVFLRYGRWSGDKSWKLIPLTSFFQNSTNNQVERIVLEDGVPPSVAQPYMPRANADQTDIQNFMSGVASTITDYMFSPMVALDDSKLTNKPLHRYNFVTGAYEVYTEDNSFESLLKTTGEIAGKGLYAYNKSQQLLVNANKTKTSGLMITPILESQTFFNKDKNKVNMIKDLLFLNEAVCFRAPGLTIRTPGKFIFIDRITSTAELNPFDDRFLGQWMMTKVVHIFTPTNYQSDIIATKIDAFSKYFSTNENVI